MGRSNKYNKLWHVIVNAGKKDVINFVRDTLDKKNAIYAEDTADMDTYIFYMIGTQHRFMSICQDFGSVKLFETGCEVTDIPTKEETNED